MLFFFVVKKNVLLRSKFFLSTFFVDILVWIPNEHSHWSSIVCIRQFVLLLSNIWVCGMHGLLTDAQICFLTFIDEHISRTRTNPLAIFSLPVYVLIYAGSYRFTSRSKLPVYVPPLQRPYVVYPPEGPRPPPPEELRERAREIARKRQQSWMYAVGSLGACVCGCVYGTARTTNLPISREQPWSLASFHCCCCYNNNNNILRSENRLDII